jgi:DNA polymerase zeta
MPSEPVVLSMYSVEIAVLFYSFQGSDSDGITKGIVAVTAYDLCQNKVSGVSISGVPSELDLINRTIDLTLQLDPDIIVGWDIQNASWGYLLDRARTYGMYVYDVSFRTDISKDLNSRN